MEEAVKAGVVWLLAGPASIFKEDIPLGVLTESATLNPPPSDVPATAVLRQSLSAAWGGEVTTAAAIASALSASHGKQLPWPVVAAAIDAALRGRLLERAEDSGPWPCDWPGTADVRLRESKEVPRPTPPVGRRRAEAALEPSELQDLVDGLPEIQKAGAGLNLQFTLIIEVGDQVQVEEDQVARLNDALKKACSKLQFGGV